MTAQWTASGTWLRRTRPAAAPWVRLVCLPHAGGIAAFFRGWPRDAPPDVEVVAVQYPGRLDRLNEVPVDDMDQMADALTLALLPLLDRPIALFGHSLGAAIAYEVARRMPTRTGRAPAHLFVSGHPAPDRLRPSAKHLASDDVLWEETRRLGGAEEPVLANADLRQAFLPALRADYRLAETYRPYPVPPLICPVTALLGEDDPEVTVDEADAWGSHTRAGFSRRAFPGRHFYLTDCPGPVLGEIVDRLTESVPHRPVGWAGP